MKAVQKLVSEHSRDNDSCIDQLQQVVVESLAGLYEIVSSHDSKEAAIALVSALEKGIRLLNAGITRPNLVHGCHPLIHQLGKTQSYWPGLLSVDRDQQTLNQKIISSLRLGEDAELNYKQKQWSRKTVEVRVALRLLDHRKNRLRHNEMCFGGFIAFPTNQWNTEFEKLGPLTRLNYKLWWKAFDPMFLNLYGDNFENHEVFKGYWKNSIYQNQPKARALIRRDIKKRIQQAFRSIAPKISPV